MLGAAWDKMMTLVQRPGLKDFRNMFLFINAKNLKTATKRDSLEECLTSFRAQWAESCDLQYLEPNTTWIDYGREIVHPYAQRPGQDSDRDPMDPLEPRTFMWKTCCLQSHVAHLRERLEIAGKGFRQTIYHWALTKQAGNMTLEPNESNPLHQMGHAYCQFYSSFKEILDASKRRPFDNNMIEALAVDPFLTKAVAISGAAQPTSREALERAYIWSRDRAIFNMEDCEGNSYGVREEHRVTVELMGHIVEELKYKATPGGFVQNRPCPWWTIPTRHAVSFSQVGIVRFALPFEAIRARVQGRQISWSQTKMMVMLLRGLRLSSGASHLQRSADLWKTGARNEDGSLTGPRGMGFGSMWEDFNYCWWGPGLIDWRRLDWRQEVREFMLFENNKLFQAYRRRWRKVQHTAEMYRAIDELRPYLIKHQEDMRKVERICRAFTRQCSTSYRMWAWKYFEKSMKFRSPEERLACLSGQVPLCVPEIERFADFESFHWKFPQPIRAKEPEIASILNHIWGFNDKVAREWKGAYPFRLLLQYCSNVILDTVGVEASQLWYTSFLYAFSQHNNTLPRPTRHHMVLKDSKDTNTPKRTNWITIRWTNEPHWVAWSQLSRMKPSWRTGNETDYDARVPEPRDGPGASFEETLGWLKTLS